jgi:phosphomevalonate kinase
MADIPLAGQTNVFSRAVNRFDPSRIKAFTDAGLSPDQAANILMIEGLQTPSVDPQQSLNLQKQAIDYYHEKQLQQAKEAQKLGRESLGITSLYNQINKLPGTIASAFGGAGERELMANLYGQIPGIVSETYRTFPRQQIQPVGYSMPAGRYFS